MITTSRPGETVEVPLGDLVEAEVRLGFGGGELILGQAEPHMLISGTFDGGVIQTSKGPGKIELEPVAPASPLRIGHQLHWNVGVTAAIPVDLRLDTGGNRSTIDLTALRIRRLELNTGASETHVRLPAAGQTSVRVACGFASVVIEVPAEVAARISGKISLGSTSVDETRFARVGNSWMSADYETAVNRVDVSIEGGFGSVRVA